jgi:hypothetical protein
MPTELSYFLRIKLEKKLFMSVISFVITIKLAKIAKWLTLFFSSSKNAY